ncbi:MAG: ATP-binding protein [Planctomycetes bacterium]|nr:ATP-binding protein [Planctomycetota bacterium]
MLKLEVLNTAFKGKRFRWKDGLTVGSGPQATIRAQHQDLADLHIRFYNDAGKPMVEVIGKGARLYVNGHDVMRSALRHQDEIAVGPLRFKVVDQSMMSSASLRLDQLVDQLEAEPIDEVHDFAKEDLFYLTTKDSSLRNRVSFSIPSKDRFIEQAQVFLARLVKQSSAKESQVEGFMTCAKELILNAHRHGHKYDESKTIVIRYRDLGPKVQLTIEDEGPGFDHHAIIDAVKHKGAAQSARERYQAGGFGGLGFQLITKMSEELAYTEPGNKVTFSVSKEPKKPS